MKNTVLGTITVALATRAARAVPQRLGIGLVPVPTVFPASNATLTPKPTSTGSSCEASCEAIYPELYGITWAREDLVTFTETITVGTVVVETTFSLNNTAKFHVGTKTLYDDWSLTDFYTLYHVSTDAGGTKVAEATITISGTEAYTTTFAYPTGWVEYGWDYHWQGVLPTLNPKNNAPICASSTEELAFGQLPSHPLYPQPTNIPEKKDPEGVNYVPLWIALQDLPDKKWFDNNFPTESAFASCESVQGKRAPTDISTAKFVLATITTTASLQPPDVVHVESTVSSGDWGGPTSRTTNAPSDGQPTMENEFLEPSETTLPRSTSPSIQIPEIPIVDTSVPPWDTRPSARPSQPLVHSPSTVQGGGAQPAPTGSNGGGQPAVSPGNNGWCQPPASLGNDKGVGQPAPTNDKNVGQPNPVANNPGQQLSPSHPTPIFTFVPTTINGRPTAAPAFILPGSTRGPSSTATIGQTVTFNGQTTVLTAPTAVFVFVPTTINNIATSVPAFIISGTSTASIGQTVTLDGKPTMLAAPAPFATEIPTTIFGIETHVTAFIISGSITAFPGETVTLGGQVTALPTSDVVFTTLTTKGVDGKETVVPAYIISGIMTATIGQTVTVDGTKSVLSMPTADKVFTSITTRGSDGRETVVPAYIISGSITATMGQTVIIGGTKTVLGTPSSTDASAKSFPGGNLARPKETGKAEGAGVESSRVEITAVVLVIGALAVAWLW